MRTLMLFLLASMPFAASAQLPIQRTETCSVVAGSPSQMVASPKISVLHLTDTDTFSLPPGSPNDVGAVVCERLSIVPAKNDYKVLEAGFPFAISVPGRETLWLEINVGQLGASYKEGELTADEASRLQKWLDEAQRHFTKQDAK